MRKPRTPRGFFVWLEAQVGPQQGDPTSERRGLKDTTKMEVGVAEPTSLAAIEDAKHFVDGLVLRLSV
jgi:hypothetical protein